MSSAPAVEDALIEAFAAEHRTAAQMSQLRTIEDKLAPLQIAEVLPRLMAIGGSKGELVVASPIVQLLRSEKPQPYVKRELAPDVEFCSAGGSRKDKTLIVAFCCRPGRLFMPLSVFLQMLPAGRFDIVILRDATQRQFLNGILGYAESMPELCQRLSKELDVRAYSGLITYGTSMGGVPALRAGPLLSARKSICVGGTFPWEINWLLNPRRIRVPSPFEPLCACMPPSTTEMVCVYGEGYGVDHKAPDRLRTFRAITDRPILGVEVHNVIYHLFQTGELQAFYGELFGFDPETRSVSPTSGRLKRFIFNFVLKPLGLRKKKRRARPPKVI